MSEQVASPDSFSLEDVLEIPQFIYQPATLGFLVGHLEKGIAAGSASPALCVAILRLYLLYPQCAEAEVVRKILAHAIVQMQDVHFAYFLSMVPPTFNTPEETKRVTDVLHLQELIEGCRFKQAWELLRQPDMSDVLHMPGLQESLRRFVCETLQMCCGSLALVDLAHQLNLGQSGASGFEEKVEKLVKARGWIVDDSSPAGKVVRIVNASNIAGKEGDNQPKPASTRAAVAHKTVEKYLSPEGLQHCLAILRS